MGIISMNRRDHIRVGVVFGGRSGEHEVSLASAHNVVDALKQAGYTVVPIGITPHGRWLTSGDPMKQLTDGAASMPPKLNGAMLNDNSLNDNGLNDNNKDAWALLPRASEGRHLPSIDVIFPVLHGTYGEDGTIQGMLEMANLPYVGCGVLSSAVAMDKAVAKRLFADAGLRQAAYQLVMRSVWTHTPEAIVQEVEERLRYPMFVKPANLGSSIGVSKARDRSQLAEAIDLACQYDRKALVEEAVPNAREIEVSVLGNDDPIASVPGEVVPGNEFYDYAAKYLSDNSRLIIPASLEGAQADEVREMAVRAFRAADCAGLARVDFLLDDGAGRFYLNEINTMPGFTRFSMYPKLWEATGIPYPELVDRLIQLAMERYHDRQQNCTTR
jgi:D-alanine-D-alanine ligase